MFALLAAIHGHRLCRSLFKHMHIKAILIKAYFKKCPDKYFNSFFCYGCLYTFKSRNTFAQMVFFIPSARVKCKKMIDISGYNASLSPDGMRVKSSEDCCLESNPLSSKC